ncbi:MAG: hypothetical protein FJY65_01960 [Calditrichaeota bacterium]|nr:hypothetical protein [Calditrichota bacterium]
MNALHKKFVAWALCLSAVFGACSAAYAQPMRYGRSVALAGSGALGMYGVQAEGWNPANLGLKANSKFSVQLPSFGMFFGNNAFTPQYISDTFQEGSFLDSTIKRDILSQMDADQLRLDAQFGLPLFGLSTERIGFNLNTHLLSKVAIPADIFELCLTGWIENQIYDFSSVEEDIMAYWTAGLTVGTPLPVVPFMKEFAVGATFRYIGGIGFTKLEEKTGALQVTNETIRAEGMSRFLVGEKGGDGVGLDLGAAGRLPIFDMYVGMTLGNLIGSINWNSVEAREKHFNRDSGLNIDSLNRNEYWKHFLYQTDTSYSYGVYETPLPRYLLLSADLPYLSGAGDLFFSYYQGLNNTAGQNTTPRLALGSEFRWIPILPLRVGAAVGGVEAFELGGGFGLRLLGYSLNFGVSWQRGVLAGAKGFSFALTQSLGPSFKRKGI